MRGVQISPGCSGVGFFRDGEQSISHSLRLTLNEVE